MGFVDTSTDTETDLVSLFNVQGSGFTYCARNTSASPASPAALQHFTGEYE